MCTDCQKWNKRNKTRIALKQVLMLSLQNCSAWRDTCTYCVCGFACKGIKQRWRRWLGKKNEKKKSAVLVPFLIIGKRRGDLGGCRVMEKRSTCVAISWQLPVCPCAFVFRQNGSPGIHHCWKVCVCLCVDLEARVMWGDFCHRLIVCTHFLKTNICVFFTLRGEKNTRMSNVAYYVCVCIPCVKVAVGWRFMLTLSIYANFRLNALWAISLQTFFWDKIICLGWTFWCSNTELFWFLFLSTSTFYLEAPKKQLEEKKWPPTHCRVAALQQRLGVAEQQPVVRVHHVRFVFRRVFFLLRVRVVEGLVVVFHKLGTLGAAVTSQTHKGT